MSGFIWIRSKNNEPGRGASKTQRRPDLPLFVLGKTPDGLDYICIAPKENLRGTTNIGTDETPCWIGDCFPGVEEFGNGKVLVKSGFANIVKWPNE